MQMIVTIFQLFKKGIACVIFFCIGASAIYHGAYDLFIADTQYVTYYTYGTYVTRPASQLGSVILFIGGFYILLQFVLILLIPAEELTA